MRADRSDRWDGAGGGQLADAGGWGISSEVVWPRLSLQRAGVSLIDCDHRTPPAASDGFPYIAIPQLKDGHVDLNGVRRIAPSDYVDWTRKLKPRANDVIVVRRCNSGDSAVVPQGLECAIGQNLVVLRSTGSAVEPRFLRWLVRGPDWWDQVAKFINVGAVFDSLRCKDIPNFELTVPPIDAQQEIAALLDSLDDRIALLRETNTTLEAIAQALFKSWFVDFDPVRAKIAGRAPEGMDEATATLFPESFAESEFGLVPKGWTPGLLGDVVRTVKSQLRPSELRDVMNYVGLEHVPRKSLSLISWDTAGGLESAKAKFSEGDVLFGRLRPYFHKVVVAPFDGVCSTDILVCQSKQRSYYGFVAFHLFSAELIAYASRLSNGAKMPRIGWSDIAAYPLIIPSEQTASAYTQVVSPLLNRMKANVFQAETLTTLRDTLLPRLISGQLRLPEVKDAADKALA